MISMIKEGMKYYLSDHPAISNFRWNPTQTWFSTWSFLIAAITSYFLLSVLLHCTLSLLVPNRRLRLRCLLAIHSLLISLISFTIFLGMLVSMVAEIRDDNNRWLWQSTHLRTTPVRWLLCFPPGTRPSGRVFFWSYAFYLSRIFVHLPRTFLKILRRRQLSFFHLLNQASLLVMSFLWLEFSQSFQVLAILFLTLLYAVVYGYRFWAAVGLPRAEFPFVVNCQVVLVGCNFACHIGVLVLHFCSNNKGGCNGIGAWCFNSICNGVVLLLFLKDFKKRIKGNFFDDDPSSHYSRYSWDSRRVYQREKQT